jgi:hypothetical protein
VFSNILDLKPLKDLSLKIRSFLDGWIDQGAVLLVPAPASMPGPPASDLSFCAPKASVPYAQGLLMSFRLSRETVGTAATSSAQRASLAVAEMLASIGCEGEG